MTKYMGGTELHHRRKIADIFRAVDGEWLYHGSGMAMGTSHSRDRVRKRYGGEPIETAVTEEGLQETITAIQEKADAEDVNDTSYREGLEAFQAAAADAPTEDELADRHDIIDDVKAALVGDVTTFESLAEEGLDAFLTYGIEEQDMTHGSVDWSSYMDWYTTAVDRLDADGYPGDSFLTDLANIPHDDNPYRSEDEYTGVLSRYFSDLRGRL